MTTSTSLPPVKHEVYATALCISPSRWVSNKRGFEETWIPSESSKSPNYTGGITSRCHLNPALHTAVCRNSSSYVLRFNPMRQGWCMHSVFSKSATEVVSLLQAGLSWVVWTTLLARWVVELVLPRTTGRDRASVYFAGQPFLHYSCIPIHHRIRVGHRDTWTRGHS